MPKELRFSKFELVAWLIFALASRVSSKCMRALDEDGPFNGSLVELPGAYWKLKLDAVQIFFLQVHKQVVHIHVSFRAISVVGAH